MNFKSKITRAFMYESGTLRVRSNYDGALIYKFSLKCHPSRDLYYVEIHDFRHGIRKKRFVRFKGLKMLLKRYPDLRDLI